MGKSTELKYLNIFTKRLDIRLKNAYICIGNKGSVALIKYTEIMETPSKKRLVEILELAKSRKVFNGTKHMWGIKDAMKQGDYEYAWKLILGRITTMHYAGIVTPEECLKHTNEGLVLYDDGGRMFSTLWRDGKRFAETSYYGNGKKEAHAVLKDDGTVSIKKWNRDGVFLGTFLEKREKNALLIF